MEQTGQDDMRKIVGVRLPQERTPPHDVKPCERHQHRMFDVMIERVAVSDALKGKLGG